MTDIKEAHGLEIFTVPDWYLADCRKNPRDKDVVLLSDATAVIDQLKAENERLGMQLVGCGVVSLANTPDSARLARDMPPDYMSAACSDVARAVDREMALRAQLDEAQAENEVLTLRVMAGERQELDAIMEQSTVRAERILRLEDELAKLREAQEPVQEPARNPDVLALNAAREIMALVYGPTPLGGSPQLLAQIQCVVSEAIVYAAPQPVSDAYIDQLKAENEAYKKLHDWLKAENADLHEALADSLLDTHTVNLERDALRKQLDVAMELLAGNTSAEELDHFEAYRCEVCVIEIYDFDNDVAAKVACFDSEASCVTVMDKNVHTVESWRELSAKIEEALLQIHPAK